MSFVKIWVHAVWTTKNRQKLLIKDKRKILFEHIVQNSKQKEILVEEVNGYLDHVHCLFRLKNDQTISKVMQLIKGESGFWANKQGLFPTNLTWQKEYYAVSVSESIVQRVKAYIQNQEEHHKTKTWEQEVDEFVKKYGLQKLGG